MKDLTRYTEHELTLLVFNTEELYDIRHDTELFHIIAQDFTFTPTQLRVLLQDLETDRKELEDEACNAKTYKV